jgi:hypothetical protein
VAKVPSSPSPETAASSPESPEAAASSPKSPEAAAPSPQSPAAEAPSPQNPARTEAPKSPAPIAEAPPQSPAPTAEAPSSQIPEPSAEAPTAQTPAPSGIPSLASPEPGPDHSVDDQSPTIVKDQVVTVTSAAIVRDGPSSSAKIIGRAYAGATARVAATDAGWAQVLDPASGQKGWVEYSVLAPSTTTAATDDGPDAAAPDDRLDQRAARSENRSWASKSKKHSARAKRHRANHHHRHRRFAFRFFLRFR